MTAPDKYDAAHFALDALTMLKSAIERDPGVRPWQDYEEHAVSTRAGYMAALELARTTASEVLS